MTWFGSLDLAYKYAIIFGSLLALTIVAGAIKVLYDRNRINKAAKEEASLESGRREEQMELNQREKDEGDLFGIRAIEAGFYGGVSQSRPTSRAGSVAGTNTLVGSVASPKTGAHSAASSMSHLPLSDNLRSDSTKRKSPPSIKLRPSEAELNGRINHSGVVNMNLTVPPSPVHARGPQSPTFGGSDSGDSDGNASPRSLSPRSANFKPDHYAPVPPQIPMPSGIRVSVHSPEPMVKSQSASFNDQSPGQSPGNSAPPSPGMFPQTKLPSMPARAFRDEPRSLFPTQAERQPFLPEKSAARGAGIEQPRRK
ncbi:hypothetical protein CC78DRAFT_190087 [Lojkania enalia]|uniref:Uncharacterized protein n=1 Tax=Lojkania enalia TaxID=147567 RepID=A0A9P4NB69_9PLEO|nr:hypothetical protein CC78DRAFT_190087 [Didymosphaeria enalia]